MSALRPSGYPSRPTQSSTLPSPSSVAAATPFIYAGGGVIAGGASEELRSLVERLKAPVALSLMGHGAFPSRHPLFTGMIGMHGTKASNMASSRSDLLIAIGARFSDRVVSDASRFALKARLLHIDIDPAEINKNVPSHQSLVGDVKDILTRLLARLPERAKSAWNGDIDAWKAEVPSAHGRDTLLHPKFIMEEIHGRVGDDAIVTTEVGQHQMWTAQFYPFAKPRTFISSGGLGTMGFGTGAAMGAQIANPSRQVVHIAGDGSFRMNCAELATIAHYELPILIVVMNNGVLGMVRQWQSMFYQGRYSQTTLDRPPDFLKLAEAYGVRGFRARDEGEFRCEPGRRALRAEAGASRVPARHRREGPADRPIRQAHRRAHPRTAGRINSAEAFVRKSDAEGTEISEIMEKKREEIMRIRNSTFPAYSFFSLLHDSSSVISVPSSSSVLPSRPAARTDCPFPYRRCSVA